MSAIVIASPDDADDDDSDIINDACQFSCHVESETHDQALLISDQEPVSRFHHRRRCQSVDPSIRHQDESHVDACVLSDRTENSNSNHINTNGTAAVVTNGCASGGQTADVKICDISTNERSFSCCSFVVSFITSSFLWTLSHRDKLVLFCLAVIEITSQMCLSIMAPFFPTEVNYVHPLWRVNGLLISSAWIT